MIGKNFKPTIICIETVPHTSGKQNKNSQIFLEFLGYEAAHKNNTNIIYRLEK